MFQRIKSNWKTTSAGLGMILGSIIHLIFAIKGHTADENTWTITLGTILGGGGLIFAGDASHSEKNAVAIDQINQAGPDPSAPPLAPAKPTPSETEIKP